MKRGELIGTLRFWQILGQGYADMFRGSFTASGLVTLAATWLGVDKPAALVLGAVSIVFWIALAVLFGYLVARYRVIHATSRQNLEADEYQRRTVQALERIEQRLSGLSMNSPLDFTRPLSTQIRPM